MSWNREEVQALIDEYRKWPNLFNPKSANYKNRNLRQTALENIFQVMKEVKPCIKSVEEIQAKFQALKANLIKERNKYLTSIHSGMAHDEVYRPTLWYYETMEFVLGGNVPRPSVDTISEQLTSQITSPVETERYYSQENTQEDVDEPENEGIISKRPPPNPDVIEVFDLVPTSASSSRPTSSLSQTPKVVKKRKTNNLNKNGSDEAMREASGALKAIAHSITEIPEKPTSVRTPSSCFGEFVSLKLNCITDGDIRNEVEYEIIQVLYNGIRRC